MCIYTSITSTTSARPLGAVAEHAVDGVSTEDGRAHQPVALRGDHEEVEHGTIDVADARVGFEEPLTAFGTLSHRPVPPGG